MSEPMSNDTEVKALRDQIARLITQNLELKRQLEELRREQADATMADIAAATVHAVRAAEQAIAAESPDGHRYIISELQTTLRGYIAPRADQFVLRLPTAQQAIPPGYLGSLQLTVGQMPALPAAPILTQALVSGLEEAQALFSKWEQTPGAPAAQAVVTQLTHLLALHPNWEGAEFSRAMFALADAIAMFSATFAHEEPAEVLHNYQNSLQEFYEYVRDVLQANPLIFDNLHHLTALFNRLIQHLQTILFPMTAQSTTADFSSGLKNN